MLRKPFLSLLAAFLLQGCFAPAFGQQAALSTNLAEYLNFGTLNAEASVSLTRHWSLHGMARYNPFSYVNGKDETLQHKQRSFATGARYWPWHVYSGWWLGTKAQFQEYNSGGILSRETQEGRRYGLSAMAGYSYMIGPHLDMEFGLGLWGGWDRYTRYDCPVCGTTTGSGSKGFFLPDDLVIAVTYIF